MSPDAEECPGNPQEIAEAYIRGTLSATQASAFETHYVGCNFCTAILEETAAYVDAMRAAAETLRAAPKTLSAKPTGE